MSGFAWGALVHLILGETLMLTGAAIGEARLIVLVGIGLAILHVGYALTTPELREQRAAKQLAR